MKGFASKLKGVGGDALSKSRDAAGALKGAGAAINARRKSTTAGAPAAEESYTPPSYSPPPTAAAASSSAAPDATYTVTDGVWTKVDASGATTVVTPPADLAALVSAEEVARLRHENESLRGEMNLLKFKIELLVDMVTLANLDCDKLEAKGG